MLSDMGSQGGMWIGLNILAVLIFIELVIASLVYLLCHVYTKCKRKCNRTKFEKQEAEKKAALKNGPKRFVEVDIPLETHPKDIKVKVEARNPDGFTDQQAQGQEVK